MVLSIAASAFIVGHEVGFGRFQEKYTAVKGYAIMLENENARLNKKIRSNR